MRRPGLRWPRPIAMLLLLGELTTSAVVAQAPDPVEAARRFYVGAAYEDALVVLRDTTTPEGLLYRALCLMALARTTDARRTIETLVRETPEFAPADADLPPRFLTLFSETRQQVLPQLMRDRFADAKRAYEAEAFDSAIAQFEYVLALLEEPVLAESPTAADYALLSTAYIEVSQQAKADRAAAEAARLAEEQEAARLAAEAMRQPSEYVPPVAIRQTFPPWPGRAGSPDLIVGVVRLTVDTTGRVVDASMATPMHPAYDIQLIAAALTWLYQPATVDGVPVQVQHVVEVRLSR